MLALLFVTHFVADFLLQSREMGKKKSSEPAFLAFHLLIQFFSFWFVLWATTNVQFAFVFALSNAAIHGIIDWNIWRLYKLYAYKAIAKNPQHPLLTGNPTEPWKYWEDHWFYSTIGLDQLLHGLTLIGLAALLL